MSALAGRRCLPCEGKVARLSPAEIPALAAQVPQWEVVDHHHLRRAFRTKDFAEAFAVVKKVSALSEKEYHHPEIRFGWGTVEIRFWTHKVDGLTENDFIMAAKIDKALRAR